MQLRIDLGGKTYQTRRTYWAGIEAVLHWGVATGRLDRDPSIGLPKVKRIVAVEQPVADRIPEEAEIWETCGVRPEPDRRMRSPSPCCSAATELFESASWWRFDRRVWLARSQGASGSPISTQRRRFPKRHSDDGVSSSDLAPPKGRIAGPNARRRCYIPAHVVEEIAGYLESRSDAEFLFMGDRGRPQSTEGFREQWNRVIAALAAGPSAQGDHPALAAPRRHDDVAPQGGGPEVDPGVGRLALPQGDARHLRRPASRCRGGLHRPARGSKELSSHRQLPKRSGSLHRDRPRQARDQGIRTGHSMRRLGAGDGNRTRVPSLGSSCSASELHPRGAPLCLMKWILGIPVIQCTGGVGAIPPVI